MSKKILSLILLILLIFSAVVKESKAIGDSYGIYSNIENTNHGLPIFEAAASTSEGMDKLFEHDPLIYLIVTGLVTAIGALSMVLRVLWKREEKLTDEIKDLNKEKLELALEVAAFVKEAISLVRDIHQQVLKLTESEVDRRIYDVDVKNQLINMSDEIELVSRQVDKVLEEIKGK